MAKHINLRTASRIKKWLGERSQREGAECLGISQQTMSMLLRGHEPAFAVRLALRRIVGVKYSAWRDNLGLRDAHFREPNK
jgi:transcriptional regulator with XRE-family HTH domain